jgi:Chain length determinant protein
MGRLVLSARRRWAAIGAAAVLGLLAGAGYAALSPPVLTSNALVVLPASTHNTATQVVIARSNPVLAAALQYSGVADLTDRHPRLAIDHGLAVHRASLQWAERTIAALCQDRAGPAPGGTGPARVSGG